MKLTQKGFTIIEGLLILVVIGIIGFTGYRVYTANQNASDTLSKSDDVADQEIIKQGDNNQEAEENTVPDGWAEYENEDFGYKFYYPNKWGDVKEPSIEVISGDVGDGKQYGFKFTNNSYINIGGATLDFHVGRGGDQLTGRHKGWEQEGNDFYLISNYSPGDPDSYRMIVNNPEFIQGINAKAIFYTSEVQEDGGYLPIYQYYVASFNTSSSEYHGVAFAFSIPLEEKDKDFNNQVDEFKQFLGTVEIL